MRPATYWFSKRRTVGQDKAKEQAMRNDPSLYPQHPMWQAFAAFMNTHSDDGNWQEEVHWKPFWTAFLAGVVAEQRRMLEAMSRTEEALEQRGL